MYTEFEIKFLGIDKDEMRSRLQEVGAVCIYEERTMKRKVFNDPAARTGVYRRVRDEGDKTTFCMKVVEDITTIEGVKEQEVVVSDFDKMCEMLECLGAKQKSFQVTKREKWIYNDCEICIDERPGIRPFVEIEGKESKSVENISVDLGFDFSTGIFGTITNVAYHELGLDPDYTNSLPLITFDHPIQSISGKISNIQ